MDENIKRFPPPVRMSDVGKKKPVIFCAAYGRNCPHSIMAFCGSSPTLNGSHHLLLPPASGSAPVSRSLGGSMAKSMTNGFSWLAKKGKYCTFCV